MADTATTPAQPQGATGVVVLADGTVDLGHGLWRSWRRGGRGLLQHRDDRLSGGDDRSQLRRADRHLHLPAYRQCRRQCRRCRKHSRGRGGLHRARSGDPEQQLPLANRNLATGWRRHGKIGLSGVDTRALTRRIRMSGAPNAVIAHSPDGKFDVPAVLKRARNGRGWRVWTSPSVSAAKSSRIGKADRGRSVSGYARAPRDVHPHVVAIDYGSKDNIFRNLVKAGARVTVLPAKILA